MNQPHFGGRSHPTVAQGIVRATGLIALVTLIARIAGFVRYLVFGASVGAGDVGTAYTSANLVPSVLFEVAAGGALATMVIPLIAGLPLRTSERAGAPGAADRSGTSDANGESEENTGSTVVGARVNATDVVSVLLLWTLTLTTALAVVVAIFAEPLATIIFDARMVAAASMTEVGARMLRVFALQLPLYGLAIVCGAFLQARKRFLWPAVAPLVSSVVVMLTYGAYALAAPAAVSVATLPAVAEALLAWGTTGGVLAMALCVVVPSLREGLRPAWRWRLPRGLSKRAWALAGAGIVAVAAQQGVIALILVLASRAGGTGTLPLYQYSQAVYLLPYAILIVPVMTSVFPHLSELRLVGEKNSFSHIARASMITVVTLGAVGGAALWGAAVGIESFFSAVDRSAVAGVGATTAALALGLIGYGIVMHATRILNANMRAGNALVVGAVPWIIAGTLIVVCVLSAPTRRSADAAALMGLCIAAGMTIGAMVALAFLEERVYTVRDARVVRRALTVAIAASAISSVVSLFLSRLVAPLMTGAWTSVLLGGVLGIASAALCLGIIALGDRAQAREVVSRVRASAAKVLPS